jgi:hypothetical protein
MTSYTLNDPTKLWGITASTIAPKTSGTLAVTATTVNSTTVNANTLQPYGVSGQLGIMADTITPSDLVRGLTISSTTVNSTTVNANAIRPLVAGQYLDILADTIMPNASTLSINATAIGSPATSSLTITPSAGREIIFNTNYIKINGTKIYVQQTDPGAVGAGSIWFDLP